MVTGCLRPKSHLLVAQYFIDDHVMTLECVRVKISYRLGVAVLSVSRPV